MIADLMDLSPMFAAWRQRVLREGQRGRLGYALDIGEGVSAVVSNYSHVSFVTEGVVRTRVQLNHASRPNFDRPLLTETGEHFALGVSLEHDDIEAVSRVFRVVSGAELTLHESGPTVSLKPPLPQVLLRRSRDWFVAFFDTSWVPLDVLKVVGQDAVLFEGRVIPLSSLSHASSADRDRLASLYQLSPPSARRLVGRLLMGDETRDDLVEYEVPRFGVRVQVQAGYQCLRCSIRFSQEVAGEPNQYTSRVCSECAHALLEETVASFGDRHAFLNEPSLSLPQLAALARALGQIPTANWQLGVPMLEAETYLAVHGLIRVMPTPAWYKRKYGSWFHALVLAGVVDEGTQKMIVGYRTLAKDGHLCSSLGEKTIDDWLTSISVPHEREPCYPGSGMRADFLANGRFIEFFGLAGDSGYDEKSVRKRELARLAGISLVEVFPDDLLSWDRTRSRLASELGIEV